LNRCTGPRRSPPFAIAFFTNIWRWPTPFGTAARVSAALQKLNCPVAFENAMNDSNREQLITAARLLRPLLADLVFVGGTVTGLLITDEAAAPPRPTLDVDAIAEITSYAEYASFGDRLRALVL
jgi:hypothetical protein